MSTGTQTEVVMPQMGVSVSEGTITKWLKQVGDSIQRDEPLLEISTDKVDTEVPSAAEGVVTQILVQEGETVEVGTVLAIIAPAGAEVAPPEPEPVPVVPEPASAPAEPEPELAAQKVNLTYLAFIARATVDTLLDYPWVNGELRGQSIVTRPNVNLGIAVALDEGKGLIVPVIRNAQDLNLTGTARAIQDIAERARTKKLLPDDVQGGTFTITNPGSFGTFHGTPIINQPQSAILGTYALVKRPWVIQDDLGSDVIAIRPVMNLTLTYDHRLVDGAYAGMCLRDIRDRLESWDEAGY